MDVTAILVGGGGRKSARRHERAAWEAEQARELALQVHDRNEKLNAALRRDGAKGRFVCGPRCERCFPPATIASADLPLDTLDLRGGAGTRPRVVLRGKRGRCQSCGAKRLPNRRAWYCDDCALSRARRRR